MSKVETMRLLLTAVVASAGIILTARTASASITHVVGGNLGWTVPDNRTYYDEWAKRRTFGVGDKLLFSYKPPSDNVMMMKKEDYENCTQKDPIDSWYTGQTVLDLDRPGDYYFTGGVGLHCEFGARMHVHVIDGPGKAGEGDFDFHFYPHREMEEVAETVNSGPGPSGAVPAGGPVATAAPDSEPGAPDAEPAASCSFRVLGSVGYATLLSFLLLVIMFL